MENLSMRKLVCVGAMTTSSDRALELMCLVNLLQSFVLPFLGLP